VFDLLALIGLGAEVCDDVASGKPPRYREGRKEPRRFGEKVVKWNCV